MTVFLLFVGPKFRFATLLGGVEPNIGVNLLVRKSEKAIISGAKNA